MKNIYKTNENICITNDEKIEKGDWCMSLCDDESYEEIYQCKDVELVDEEDKKIILTDNKDLIKDGVQAIDDEFLEWFVKNPSCEEVKTYYIPNEFRYELIIPKEETKIDDAWLSPMQRFKLREDKTKQETLEEAYLNQLIDEANKEWTLDRRLAKEVAIKFSKWEQEQNKNKFNDEEVKHIVSEALQSALVKVDLEQWFKQHIKK